MANDKPDVNRVIGWLRATGPIVIGIVGLVVTWKIGRIQEDRSEHEFRTQAMVQREQSETEFRQAMFEALAEKMFSSSDSLPERLKYFEVFQLNFHNLFNARPLYSLLAEQILAEEITRGGKDSLREDLESLGKRIAKDQTTIILAAQGGCGQYFLDLKLKTPDTVRLGSLDSEEETESMNEHVLRVTLIEVEEGRARVTVEINPERSDSDSWKSEYWTSTFNLRYYDAPFTDNTLLPDGHRIALSLWKTTDNTASLSLLEFPAHFITVAYRPSLQDLDEIQKHLHEANGAPDSAEHREKPEKPMSSCRS